MEREPIKNAVIYCRVSTKEQVEEGNSLVTQEKICREYASRFGFTIANIFIEQGESAKTTNRTELQKMLSFCALKKNAVSSVIVYKIDRLSRNMDDYSDIRMMLKAYGVRICSTSEQFDNKPAGRFMENILANVAQFDNDVRTERSVNGMKEAVRDGRYVWKAPFGYINGKINGKTNIIIEEKSAAIIRKTFAMVCGNKKDIESVRKIMFTEGLTVSKSHFYRILKNKMYCGIMEQFGEVNTASYEPLISKEQFDLVQMLFKNPTRKVIPYKSKNPDFPLRRFVTSPTGLKLTGSWSTGKLGKKFPYYRFKIKGSNYNREKFEDAFCDFMNTFGFDREFLQRLREIVKTEVEKRRLEEKNETEKASLILNDLKEKQTILIQKNLKGVISDELLKEQLAIIQASIMNHAINMQQPELNFDSEQIDEIFEFMEEYLVKPGDTWKKADYNSRLQLQVFEFPHGVVFDGEKFRTPYIGSIFKLKNEFAPVLSPVVSHRGKIKNTPYIPNSPPYYISKLGKAIKECSQFIANMQEPPRIIPLYEQRLLRKAS